MNLITENNLLIISREQIYQIFVEHANVLTLWSSKNIIPVYVMNIDNLNENYKTLIIDIDFNAWLLPYSSNIYMEHFFKILGCQYQTLCEFISMKQKIFPYILPYVFGQNIILPLKIDDLMHLDWINIGVCQSLSVTSTHTHIKYSNTKGASLKFIMYDIEIVKCITFQLEIAKQITNKYHQLTEITLKKLNYSCSNMMPIEQINILNQITIQPQNKIDISMDDLIDFHHILTTKEYLIAEESPRSKRLSQYFSKYYFDKKTLNKAIYMYKKKYIHTSTIKK